MNLFVERQMPYDIQVLPSIMATPIVATPIVATPIVATSPPETFTFEIELGDYTISTIVGSDYLENFSIEKLVELLTDYIEHHED